MVLLVIIILVIVIGLLINKRITLKNIIETIIDYFTQLNHIRQLIKILISVIAVITLSLVIDITIDIVFKDTGESFTKYFLNDAIGTIIFIIVAIAFIKTEKLKVTSESKFLSKQLLRIYVPLTFAVFCLNYFLLIPLGETIFNDEFLKKLVEEYYRDYTLSSQVLTFQIFLFFSFAILTPICEEIYFRGFCYNYIRVKYKIVFSIAITFLIFFLFHPLPSLILSLLVFTIYICIVFEKTKEIRYPILIHILYNSIGFIIQIFFK